jgi:type I restriction enzyme S subunit
VSVQTVQLGEICEFIRGVTFDKNEATTTPTVGKIPILRAGNIGEDLDAQNDLVWVPERLVSSEQRLRQNDIAICMSSGSPEVVGKTARAASNLHASVGSFCGIIRPKYADQAAYLSFFFRSPAFYKHRDAIARGANIQNLRFSQFEEIDLEIPVEHKRIAGLLEQADRLRRTRRYALELSDTFLPAAFLELFGDPSANTNKFPRDTIDAVCEKIIDYRGRTPEYSEVGIPHVTAACIKEWEIKWQEAKRVSEQTFAEYMTRGLPKIDDVLLTTEAPLGETAVVRTRKSFSLAQRLILLRPSSRLMSDYLCHLLGHALFRNELLRFATGSTVKGISSENLQGIRIPISPIKLQERFGSLVALYESLRAGQREALRQAEHHFQSLLHHAFP